MLRRADRIIALYEANRLRQIADGAPPERTENIPNGINLPALQPLRARRPAGVPPVLCLIGRVVPIKDVKTFVRAMRTRRQPDARRRGLDRRSRGRGPGLRRECRTLVGRTGLKEQVQFLGFQKIDELLPKVGLVVLLSSISEALPLVLLEGFAAGVPCGATDVGSCRQLVHGLDAETTARSACPGASSASPTRRRWPRPRCICSATPTLAPAQQAGHRARRALLHPGR
jgi:glycosyltransferase involved in cell wall biosynthesis